MGYDREPAAVFDIRSAKPRRRLDEIEGLSGTDAIWIRTAIVSALRTAAARSEAFLSDALSLTVYQLEDRSWTAEVVLEDDPNHLHRIAGDHEAVQKLLRLDNRAVDALVFMFTGK